MPSARPFVRSIAGELMASRYAIPKGLHFVLIAVISGVLLVSAAQTASSGENPARGKLLYTERCVFCHGDDGSGRSLQTRVARLPFPVPDLTNPEFMSRFSGKELFNVIKEGGTRAGKSRFMPPAGRWLSDDDIRDVIVYLRSLERSPSGDKSQKK
jgi:cytochrome c